MEFLEALEKLENKEEFKEWKSQNKDHYLAHGFMMLENNESWQIGYTDGNKVTSFIVEPFQQLPEDKAYKKPNTTIKKLDKNEVKMSLEKAKEIFNNTIKEHYPKESTFKTIVLLQNEDGHVEYNITAFTNSFKTMNVKIDMEGNVLDHSLQDIISKSY